MGAIPVHDLLILRIGFTALGLLRLLLTFPALPEVSRKKRLQFFIFDLFLRLDNIGLVPDWRLGDGRRTSWEKGDSEMEPSHKSIRRGVANGERRIT